MDHTPATRDRVLVYIDCGFEFWRMSMSTGGVSYATLNGLEVCLNQNYHAYCKIENMQESNLRKLNFL